MKPITMFEYAVVCPALVFSGVLLTIGVLWTDWVYLVSGVLLSALTFVHVGTWPSRTWAK